MLASRLPYGPKRLAAHDPSWIELDVHAPSGHTVGRPSSTGTAGDYVWASQSGAYRTFQYGDGLQGDAIWWDFDVATGGKWDLEFWYVTGFDCGIISVRVDGRQVALVDMYTVGDVLDNVLDVTAVPIGAGRHRLSLHAIGANPSAVGQAGEWVPYFYYDTIQRLILRRTALLPALVARPRPTRFGGPVQQRVDIDPLFCEGNTTWGTVTADGHIEGAKVTSTGLGATRFWYRDLAAGDWDVEVIHGKDPSYGIFALSIDGREAGRIDGYGSPASNALRVRGPQNVKSTVRASIPTTGRHKIALTVVDFNALASNVFAELRHLSFRQVRALPNTVQRIHPGVVQFDILWDHGHTGWGGYSVGTSYVHGVDRQGSAVNDTAYWYDHIPKGTYDVEVIYSALSSRGIVDVLLDDVAIGTIDTYSAGGANNTRVTFTGVLVTTGGRHKVSLKITGKNASSSGYPVLVSAIQFRKTSDAAIIIPPVALTQIPVMTSNTTPLGIASASSELTGGGYEAYCAMNPAAGNARGWLNDSGTAWIAYQFPSPVTVHTYSLRPWWFNVFPGRTPKTWTFEGWNGVSWDVLDTVTNHNWLGDSTTVISFTVASPGSYAKYRLNVSANGGDAYTGLGSIQMTV